MGAKLPIQFCLQHATFTVSVGIVYLLHIYMGQTASLPKEGMLRIFSPEKSDSFSRV
jgi:hypothetical protein